MAYDQLSTSSMYDNTSAQILKTQNDLFKLQRQVSSGNKAESYVDYEADSNVENIINYDYNLQNITDYSTNNQEVINRLTLTHNALDDITKLNEKMISNVSLRMTKGNETMNIGLITKEMLASIQDRLNTQLSGRYLFAGSNTNVPPVKDIASTSNIISDQITANYYQGDNVVLAVTASDSLTINYGVTANDKSFQDMIGAMNMILEAEAVNDITKFKQAFDLLTKANTEVIQVRANMGNNITTLENTIESNVALNRFFTEIKGKAADTDIVQASAQVSVNETILRASYTVFARLSKMNLADYL